MAGSKPMSWKWKLTIVFVVLFIFGLGFAFSTWGQAVMADWIRDAYNQCPPEERRTHPSADYYLALADFEARICWRDTLAMDMYKEFLAIKPGKHGEFMATLQSYGPQWNGFFEAQSGGKTVNTGWGILHERAPEAYYRYLVLYDPLNTEQTTTQQAVYYHTLFYTLYPQLAKNKGWLPHPKFYKYWQKITDQLMDRRFIPQGADISTQPKPNDYEGPIP